ncbi:MAG TPA: hypothetical protein VJO34_11795 [Methylomirabilota bacterium]|nr:hypothetical protein [Methylomirabilota bacterium]
MDKELIEYLDRRFDESKHLSQQLFEEADQRFQQRFDDAKRYIGVVGEDLDGKIQLVTEGVSNLDETFERRFNQFQEETRREFRET